MKFRAVLASLGAIALVVALAIPAQAAVPRIAITCGMTVAQDAYLYLPNDLYCTDGVGIVRDEGAPGPDVTVDLQGHTFRGPGHGVGIGGSDVRGVQVVNGRVENWQYGVAGDTLIRVTNVKFVANIDGLFCNGLCTADLSYFKDNSAGFNVAGEAAGSVKRSTFLSNHTGATVGFPQRLSIESSAFLDNEVGVFSAAIQLSISYSIFAKNRTGVQISADHGCGELYKVAFYKNGTNVDGPTC